MTIEDALDYCLGNPDGLSNEELLARFPQHREELQPLLTLGASIQNIAPPPVPTERRAAMKSRLMSAAASLQSTEAAPAVLSTRPTPSTATEPVTQPVRARSAATRAPVASQRGWLVRWLASLQRPLAVTAAAAALIIALLWWGSARALPDSPLYTVKLAGETIQTGFGRTAAEETRNHIALANSRLRDLRTMQSQGNLTNAGSAFINYRDHLASGGTFWKQTTGNERVELARLLYGSTLAGKETFSELGNIAGSLPASMRTTIQETLSALGTINTDTAQALRTAGVDPSSVTVPADLVGRVAPTPSASVSSPGSTALSTAQGAATISPQPTSSNSVPATTVVAESPTGVATIIATATTPGTAAATTTVGTVIATPTADNTRVAATPSVSGPSPEPARTARPTNTARPAQTTTAEREPATRTPDRSSPTARPAERTPDGTPSARPTDVRVPPTPSARPSNVPVIPPTPSARPSGVPVPSQTQTRGRPTQTNPAGTSTPEPKPTSNVCDLDVMSVSISCSSTGCVDWTARVRSRGATALTANWTAELQIKPKNGGGFQTVNVQRGAAGFEPDSTTLVANSFCYSFPDRNYDARVQFSLSADSNLSCAPQRNSSIIDACAAPEPTSTARPTNTPRPTNTTRPTDTPRPRPTEEPTRARPTRTPEPEPPTSTPRPSRPTRPPEPEETPQPPRPTEEAEPTEEPPPTRRPDVTQRPTRPSR